MNDRRRPPPDITPERFFVEWLPAEFERLGSAAGFPDLRVRVNLLGPGGGTWELVSVAGKLSVGPPDGAQRPLVTLALSVPDWRAIMVGEQGEVSLTPPNASPTDLLFVDAASQQLLATMTGTFRFEVREYNGRTWQLWASFGEQRKETPDAVISTDAMTYAALLARTLAVPEAYFGGKITIDGDAARGMQVGLALLPKIR
jgi:hypothetical protein